MKTYINKGFWCFSILFTADNVNLRISVKEGCPRKRMFSYKPWVL